MVQNPNMIITENGDVHPITALNKGRGTDNMILYTPDFGTHTITNQWGTEVAVVDGVVVAVREPGTTQPFPIPENGYVLSGHGSANSWLSKHAPLGTKLEVTVGSLLGMRMTDPDFSPRLNPAGLEGCARRSKGSIGQGQSRLRPVPARAGAAELVLRPEGPASRRRLDPKRPGCSERTFARPLHHLRHAGSV